MTYDANGGSGEKRFGVEYELNGHLYPNTEIGIDRLQRDGYTLIGWNTNADGSGTRVGLGSRLAEKTDTLYAEWMAWTDASLFEVIEVDGGVVISSYLGNESIVCVPKTIRQKPVVGIGDGAFVEKKIEYLYLPDGMKEVQKGAFQNSHVEKLSYFDDLEEIYDDSFIESKVDRVHISAVLPPVSPKGDRHANYADKVDLLRSKEGKKLVLFGGSGTYFSYDSSVLSEGLNAQYEVVNMGLNAWFPFGPQADILGAFLQEGDVIVHVPEMSSKAQLGADPRFALESDADDGFDDRFIGVLLRLNSFIETESLLKGELLGKNLYAKRTLTIYYALVAIAVCWIMLYFDQDASVFLYFQF